VTREKKKLAAPTCRASVNLLMEARKTQGMSVWRDLDGNAVKKTGEGRLRRYRDFLLGDFSDRLTSADLDAKASKVARRVTSRRPATLRPTRPARAAESAAAPGASRIRRRPRTLRHRRNVAVTHGALNRGNKMNTESIRCRRVEFGKMQKPGNFCFDNEHRMLYVWLPEQSGPDCVPIKAGNGNGTGMKNFQHCIPASTPSDDGNGWLRQGRLISC
jgi:hypothetical protein